MRVRSRRRGCGAWRVTRAMSPVAAALCLVEWCGVRPGHRVLSEHTAAAPPGRRATRLRRASGEAAHVSWARRETGRVCRPSGHQATTTTTTTGAGRDPASISRPTSRPAPSPPGPTGPPSRRAPGPQPATRGSSEGVTTNPAHARQVTAQGAWRMARDQSHGPCDRGTVPWGVGRRATRPPVRVHTAAASPGPTGRHQRPACRASAANQVGVRAGGCVPGSSCTTSHASHASRTRTHDRQPTHPHR